MSEQRVWVLFYAHRHGVDISLYSSKRGAQLAAMGTVLDFLSDFTGGDDNAAADAQKLVEQEDWPGLQARLARCASDESIDIFERPILGEEECASYVRELVKEV